MPKCASPHRVMARNKAGIPVQEDEEDSKGAPNVACEQNLGKNKPYDAFDEVRRPSWGHKSPLS